MQASPDIPEISPKWVSDVCGHRRRQLWGTGARAPSTCDFCAIFINFWPIFCHFFAHSFSQGVIIVPKMPERSPINFNSTRTSDSGKTGS